MLVTIEQCILTSKVVTKNLASESIKPFPESKTYTCFSESGIISNATEITFDRKITLCNLFL